MAIWQKKFSSWGVFQKSPSYCSELGFSSGPTVPERSIVCAVQRVSGMGELDRYFGGLDPPVSITGGGGAGG